MHRIDRCIPSQERLLLLALLVGGLVIRLIAITQPFVDSWSWRQADVAMIAENFYRHGFNILYPEINWAGPAPGYVGTEFPLLPFLAAVCYLLFGVQDWIGRAISVAFFMVSVPFVYLLVRQISTARSGLLAAGVYTLTPLNVVISRSFMPDMASLSCSLAALYLFAAWLTRAPHPLLFLVTGLATSLAILVKVPAVIIGLPLFYMAWQTHGAQLFRQRALWGFAALSLLPPFAWYTHAYLVSVTYFPYHFFGERGLAIMDVAWYGNILQRTVHQSLTPVVFTAMLLGSLLPSRARFGRVFHWWFIAIILFTAIGGRGSKHLHYQLPLLPVAAAFTGMLLDMVVRQLGRWVKAKTALVTTCLLFLLPFAALSYLALRPLYYPWALAFWQAGQALNQLAPPDALLLAADYGDPSLIYYSRRKGWHFPEISWHGHNPLDSQHLIRELESRRNNGARYLILPQHTFWWFDTYQAFQAHLEAQYRRVRETEAYLIVDLRGATTEEGIEGQ
jgi:hypothetical protein